MNKEGNIKHYSKSFYDYIRRKQNVRDNVGHWNPTVDILEQISTPLVKVFNLSLEEGIAPSEWKERNITPLFKKGSRNKSENYRPVIL